MKVLLLGVGGVGEAIAMIARERPWVEKIVLADYNLERAREVQAKLKEPTRFPAMQIDASDQKAVEQAIRTHQVDMVMNAVDPLYNQQIFDAAFAAGVNYMDMAMTLSTPHPSDPFHKSGVK